jgi:hypothetical protein
MLLFREEMVLNGWLSAAMLSEQPAWGLGRSALYHSPGSGTLHIRAQRCKNLVVSDAGGVKGPITMCLAFLIICCSHCLVRARLKRTGVAVIEGMLISRGFSLVRQAVYAWSRSRANVFRGVKSQTQPNVTIDGCLPAVARS